MATFPIQVGTDVLFRDEHLDAEAELRAAKVVSVPKYLWEGKDNVDANGNPVCVDLIVFTTQGSSTKWRVRHESYGDPSFYRAMPVI